MENKKIVKIGSDGLCTCSCGDVCVLGKTGMSCRCTKDELNNSGIETMLNELPEESELTFAGKKIEGYKYEGVIEIKAKYKRGMDFSFTTKDGFEIKGLITDVRKIKIDDHDMDMLRYGVQSTIDKLDTSEIDTTEEGNLEYLKRLDHLE